MNSTLAVGAVATLMGLLGYLVGVVVDYPGRAFSLTLLMFGTALALVGRSGPADSP